MIQKWHFKKQKTLNQQLHEGSTVSVPGNSWHRALESKQGVTLQCSWCRLRVDVEIPVLQRTLYKQL